jgi:hypothetical protein
MADILNEDGPPKKKEIPEPRGDKATPAAWAARAKERRWRGAMKFAGIAFDAEITEGEFKKACDQYKKLPGDWYKKIDAADLKSAAYNPDKYMKKVVK